MTLKLANHAICTLAGIARDVFVPVGKFTFPADIVIVDYESDPRVPLILGRPFLRTARALIDIHGSNNDDAYNDPFDSKEDEIKESKLLIDELDPLRSSDFLPYPEYDSFFFENFLRLMLFLRPTTRTRKKFSNPEFSLLKEFILLFSRNYPIGAPKLSKSLELLKARWRFFLALLERTSAFWMSRVSIPHELINSGDQVKLSDLKQALRRLTLNMRHDTSSYSNQPQKESVNMINIYDDSCEDFLKDLFATNHQSGNLTFSSHPNLTSSEVKDDIFDSEGDMIEYLLNDDPTKEMDSILKDSIDKDNLADLNNNLVDTIPLMLTDEHALDYSSPPLYDDYDDDLDEFESNNNDTYNDPFESKEDEIKESKILIGELDPLRSSDFLPSPEYDSFFFENFFEVDALPSTNKEDKDFDPHLYELHFHKEVPWFETLLLFSSENEEKVFKPRILTSKGVHTSLLPELSHRGPKAFKIIKIGESLMEIFSCSFGEDIRSLDVSCLHFYPP
nr:reverse transcriptase domain-containing protein [Tanacetum cinerariifolium]